VSKLRIFLADDHAVVREGLRSLINSQPEMEVTGEAGTGRTAWQKVKGCGPDVLVVDISMPDLNGVELTERVKRDCPGVRVLALTVHEDRSYLLQLLRAGASGYVLKRAAAEELVRAIRAVATGGVYIDPAVAGKIVEEGYARKQSSQGATKGISLSERETEVLRLIARGHSNKEVANQLRIGARTVETYRTRLMEKLDLHSRADIVSYALQQGWLQNS
jgi:DNA-binding NarL/FixJ family response regulator